MSSRYDRDIGFIERLIFDGARSWAVSQARGEVIEIGVGTGLNLPLYGPAVTRVIGVDLPDGSADTVVSTLTFCSIPDPLIASRLAYRVLRPGGRFVLAEHGPSTSAIGCAVMRAIEPLTTRFLADHLTRDPVPYLKEAGLTVDEVHRGGRGGIMFRVLAHKDHG